jgi:peptide/nickel transport system permease protein
MSIAESVTELTFAADGAARPDEVSQTRLVWRRFRRHRLAVIGLVIAAVLFLGSYIGPFLSPYNPNEIRTDIYRETRNLGPLSWAPDGFHVLGTDINGRDYLTRLMYGGRVSLSLAIVVTVATMVVGMAVGGVSGFFGGTVDSVLMRGVDFLLTLPTLPLLLIFSAILRGITLPGRSMTIIAVILIVFGWMGTARLVRGMTLSLKHQEFTDAARSVGSSDRRIITRHMLPNSLAPVIVAATLGVGGIVVTEAALSFLGFGIQAPDPSWGNMLQGVQGRMFEDPFEVFYPGIMIFLTSLSFNFIGDALRDALDPRLKQ